MKFGLSAVTLLAGVTATLASPREQKQKPFSYFVNNTIYQPEGKESVTYPRFTQLRDGTILATASLSGHNPAYFPVFASKDGGASWKWMSDIKDTENGWGFPAQPALTELTEHLGDFKPGTILASGNSWSDEGTRIDLYASTDRAQSWKFVSHIAEGGRPNTTNGATPVWEPYLLVHDHSLVCYYSDQRDPKHGQKLSHQVSKDLINWDPPVNDVALEEYIARPGMTVIDYIATIKKWILVHELPVGNSSSHNANYPVYYHLADDPRDFRYSEGIQILTKNGVTPNASPYVVWTPEGGPNGTIVVSDADHRSVFTNRHGGAIDQWEEHATPAGAVYSRAIAIVKHHPDHLMIFGGETFDNMGKGLLTPFSATVVDLNQIVKN